MPIEPLQAHNQALLARGAGDFGLAVKLFRVATTAANEDIATAAHHNLGQLHRQAGRLDEAESSFRAATVSSNDDVASAACLNLGFILEQRGDDLGATEVYEVAVHSGNNDIAMTACRALGRLHMRAGHRVAALSCLRRAAGAANPDTANAAQRDLELLFNLPEVEGNPSAELPGSTLVPCHNGHVVRLTSPRSGGFCPQCGSRLFGSCERCLSPIQVTDVDWISEHKFCSGCSAPYPWAAKALVVQYLRERIAAEELTDEEYDESLQLLAVLTAPEEYDADKRVAARRFKNLVPALWSFARPLAQEAVSQRLHLE